MTTNPHEAPQPATPDDRDAALDKVIAAMRAGRREEAGRSFDEFIIGTVRGAVKEDEARVQARLREPEKLATAEAMDVVVRMAVVALHAGQASEVFRLMGRVFNEIILDTVRAVVREMGEQWIRATIARIPPAELPAVRQHLATVAEDAGAERNFEAMQHLAAVFRVVPDHALDNISLTLIGAGLRNAYEKQQGKEREKRFKDLLNRAIAAMGEAGGNAQAIAHLEAALALVPDPPVTEQDRARRKRVLDGLAIARGGAAEQKAAPAPAPTIDWVERGSALLNSDMAQALACYEKACELTPDDGGGWAGRAGVLRSLGRHDEAIRAYDRLVALVPGEADFWFERADSLESVNRLDEALASYERVLQLDPGRATAWADRGHVLQRLGRRQEALASQVKATQCDPKLALAWLNRAELERVLEPPSAAASYQRFLAVVPPGQHAQFVQHARTQLAALASTPHWQQVLGQARASAAAGKIDEAQAQFRHCIRLQPPAAAQVLHEMGIMLAGAGQTKAALASYREALSLAPDQVGTWGALGTLFWRAGRAEQATAAFRKLLAITPNDISARLGVGRLLRQQGKYQEALDELKLLRDPDPEVQYLQGSCLLGLGRFADALVLLEQVPADHPDAMIDRGICLERLQRKAEAVACFESGHPLSGRRWFHLARCHPEHAAEYLARAVQLQLALDRRQRLDPVAAAELAHARKRLAELDPAQEAALDADDRSRRSAAPALGG